MSMDIVPPLCIFWQTMQAGFAELLLMASGLPYNNYPEVFFSDSAKPSVQERSLQGRSLQLPEIRSLYAC